MIEIYEQGLGRGIGHSLDSFSNRFSAICSDILERSESGECAAIFYDFSDRATRRILKDHGVFTKLDRLAGPGLHVFYLHAKSPAAVSEFNSALHDKFGVSPDFPLPSIVFFSIDEGRLSFISISELPRDNLIHGFQQLYALIESRRKAMDGDSVVVV